ncbi:MAG: DUF3793 family protein [Fretibacterium sp.]|nr:DUF3793 family protein [Fretibacterium sp.]
MESLRGAELKEYVRGILFCFGAPTIKGLKAATLLNIRRGSEDVRAMWTAHGSEWLDPLGVDWILLNEETDSRNALALIYRRDILERALMDENAARVLSLLDYPVPDVEGCLRRLRVRYRQEFPHEIGFFLDYPPDDVMCFMEHPEAKCRMAGYWKVYGDVKKARCAFRRYRCAEREAAWSLLNGTPCGSAVNL